MANVEWRWFVVKKIGPVNLNKSPEKWECIVKGTASFISKQDKSDTVHGVTH